MILTRDVILELIKSGKLVVEPFSEDVVRENGLDLRIGNEYAYLKPHARNIYINLCDLDEKDIQELFHIEKNVNKIFIRPGEFVLLTTLEYIKLPPDVMGFCNLRSTLARFGLSIPPTIVDVGFEGNLTIEVFNNTWTTIILKPGMRFLHLILAKTEGSAQYIGVYKGQRGVRLPKSLKDECRE